MLNKRCRNRQKPKESSSTVRKQQIVTFKKLKPDDFLYFGLKRDFIKLIK